MRDADLRALEGAVAEQVFPPSFDALVANAIRRRRNAYAAAGTVAAGAVLASVAIANLGSDRARDEPARPISSTDSPTPTRTDETPDDQERLAAIVNDRDSILMDFAISPSDPQSRAAIWRGCVGNRCTGPGVLALTRDGFRTAVYVELAAQSFTTVTAVGGDDFAVWKGDRPALLASGTGKVSALSIDSDPASLARSDVVIPSFAAPGNFYAVDASALRAHRVDVPEGALGLQPAGDALVTFVFTEATGTGPSHITASVSLDGAVTWRQASLTFPESSSPELVPAGSSRTLAMVEVGENTVPPLDALWRSEDAGASWQRYVPVIDGSGGDIPYVGGAAVESDGSLLVLVIGWSDATRDTPSAHIAGLYRSLGTDWSRLEPAPRPRPAGEGGAPLDGDLRQVSAGPGGRQTLYVQFGHQIYSTDDAGASWESISSR